MLFIFCKYRPRVDSISKYKVIARKTITIGKSLKGGTRASNNLSSTLLPVFETIFLTLFTRTLATRLLINNEIINGEIKDFYFNPADESKIYPIFLGNEKSLTLIRHSTAHILAQAVQSIYPDTKVTIGPVIEDGFYYDFYTDRNFTEDDLKLFENKMQEIITEFTLMNEYDEFVKNRGTKRT